MGNVGLIGDCTDILTEPLRKGWNTRNQVLQWHQATSNNDAHKHRVDLSLLINEILFSLTNGVLYRCLVTNPSIPQLWG